MPRAALVLVPAALVLAPAASRAQTETPAYIVADPRPVLEAFGLERARKIFSHAYTPTRQQALMRSANSVRGYDCPSGPPMQLVQALPYPIRPGLDAWIERYVLACTPAAQRNFVLILDNVLPQIVELLPGATLTDPLLQRDSIRGATTSVMSERALTCDSPQITDTRVLEYPQGGGLWRERWRFDLCGARAETVMTFSPAAGGGVTWKASPDLGR